MRKRGGGRPAGFIDTPNSRKRTPGLGGQLEKPGLMPNPEGQDRIGVGARIPPPLTLSPSALPILPAEELGTVHSAGTEQRVYLSNERVLKCKPSLFLLNERGSRRTGKQP